jgi:radical SAM protein with 4Fe4S-binding SPASM domain
MNAVVFDKFKRVLRRKLDSLAGSFFFDLQKTLQAMALRPFELHLELTNICNANCVFCPYQFQERPKQFMADEVFYKAVSDYMAIQGGSVGLTPIVGDPLIDPKFLERVRYLRGQPAIDRIFLTTNAILLDRFGVDEVLTSGVNTINISTASFDRENYKKIYRSSAYDRMRNNVTQLVAQNSRLGNPVNISIGLRTDRPLHEVMNDRDFQPILKYHPAIDYAWSFTSAGGRITRDLLPLAMRLRKAPAKKEPCVNLYNGPIVLSDGNVLACSCVAAIDAVPDLLIGNIRQQSLLDIYTGELMRQIRNQFKPGGSTMNKTCANCEMYRDLEVYRTAEGRVRARLNCKRHAGEAVKRQDKAYGIFVGG